jgi:hypothetical protein
MRGKLAQMSDDKVVDIKTRRGRADSSDIMATAEQLIAMADAREIVALLSHLLHDTQGIPLLDGAPDTPDVRETIYEILSDAVAELDRLTDSFKVREP